MAVLTEQMSLYQRTLGPDFDKLPATLKRFHATAAGGTAAGRLVVMRGAGWLANVLATGMRLPEAGLDVPVTVGVRVASNKELWLRSFAGRTLVTQQWFEEGMLVERAGPLCLWFLVGANGVGLHFAFVRCALFGIPIPRQLAIRVDADVTGTAAGWWLKVQVVAPVVGMLVRYEGEVIQDC